ncbi:shikimate dehydrogenase family protein [Zunongwangia atlantica]|uniref:Shikimate 5-dehydrogenase n=1 Tax=Zunongwangia atlantica 22II14-10F7 TaxID=1185767 RepID=A0A1Y1T3J8_9FLAO|nr:shikimate dehydrogenase [Zunongwangia atlantica]ORL45322.1 shikimate 5-dehydrogenase [Zunongwangia atlantica 22II14-10F7]
MKKFGLLGKNISYSFSRKYFNEKFEKEKINAEYVNFDIPEITDFPLIITKNPTLSGMNVTIPYKLEVMKFLEDLSEDAKAIEAVNVIKFENGGKLIGHNTDFIGFRDSLKPHLRPQHTHALILGTGGASKAVAYALKTLGISYKFVSRSPLEDQFSYSDLNEEIIQKYSLIINTTPLGTFPDIENCPDIPYQFITKNHLVFDLIYNPSETKFMSNSKKGGATAINGNKMLQLQAEAAWLIWNS